jgi:hypothetical protein
LLIPFPQLRCGCQNESHGNLWGGSLRSLRNGRV